MSKITIHQPMYFPYPGILAKFLQSDALVIYDIAEYSKGYFYNRNQFFVNGKPVWLTIPIVHESHQEIRNVRVSDVNWQKKHLKTIKQYYSKSPWFDLYYPEIEKFLNPNYSTYMIDYAEASMMFLMKQFDIKCDISYSENNEYASILKNPVRRLLCLTIGLCGDEYIAGPSWKNYMTQEDILLFEKYNIKFTEAVYTPQEYKSIQTYSPYSTALDMLFSCGPDAKNILKRSIA